MPAPLDLGSFILRARALQLYRDALRVVRQAPPNTRGELRLAVRQSMDAGRDARGKDQIKFYLSEGKQRLKELTDMLGLAVVPEAAGGAAHAAARADAAGAVAAKPHAGCGTPGHRH